MSGTEAFDQLQLRFIDPIQFEYEVIRPIVLFAEGVTERSRQTGIPRTTVSDKARRFVEKGMLGLVQQYAKASGNAPNLFPEPVAAHILYLKALYPPIHYREIVRIVARRFGYKTSHHRVKRFLQQYPLPVQLALKLDLPPTYHDYEDAYQARWQVVRMHYEGWNQTSIAAVLHLSRRHVGRILGLFEREGFEGLEDKRHRPDHHPSNQLTLPLLKEVLDVQREYPRAGRFRVHGLLTQRRGPQTPSISTVGRAMALNRQFHEAPPPWITDRAVADPDVEPKHLPYRPHYRHHLWFLDIRFLVQLEGEWVYSICILEGYSRKILAGMASEYQDLLAVLQILKAALSEYGCPQGMVTDNAKVFQAHDYLHVLDALEIAAKPIEAGKAWQSLIEPNFKVQRRLADHHFEQAHTFDEIQRRHAQFIETFNTTPHWAHQERADGRHTPEQVLRWARGRRVEPNLLQHLFRNLQWIRTVNRFGFVSIQRFYLYAERGLCRQRVAIWMYEGHLHIEYQQMLQAEYHYDYDRRRKRLRAVSHPTLYDTPFASPQLELLELDDEQWQKIRRRPYQRHHYPPLPLVEQLPLLRISAWFLVLHFLAS
jgi:transposase